MDFNPGKRKLSEAIKPWTRHRKRFPLTPEEFEKLENSNPQREKFNAVNNRNLHFDIHTKCAAFKAAPSIVCLQSSIDNEELFQCSGTVIESEDGFSIILTSASLLMSSTGEYAEPKNVKITVHLPDREPIDGIVEAFDPHFNLATVSIDQSLPAALVTRVNDAISIDLNEIDKEKPFHIRPHQSRPFELVPGDLVVALGRFIAEPYELMAAPGEFCLERCHFDEEFNCKELFMTSCRITSCGTGGPLVNRYSEVIGICFYDISFAAFLPINVASLWWEHHKKYGQPCRPWMGMEATNLYTASLSFLGKVIQKFPDVVKGVLVEEVIPRSSADIAGIKHNDVIFQFDGKRVQSFLELFESMWHKVGKSVKLAVVRSGEDVPLSLTMVVEAVTSNNCYKWRLLKFIP